MHYFQSLYCSSCCNVLFLSICSNAFKMTTDRRMHFAQLSTSRQGYTCSTIEKYTPQNSKTTTANLWTFPGLGSFFLFWGGTCTLRMPAPMPASQAGPMHNLKEGTSVVLHDTSIVSRLTWWCVLCSCCATSPYRKVCRAKGGIGSGETLCHDIYPVRPITTVSLAANTYWMMEGLSSRTPRTVGPRVQFSGACEQSHWRPTSAYSRRPYVISGSSSD